MSKEPWLIISSCRARSLKDNEVQLICDALNLYQQNLQDIIEKLEMGGAGTQKLNTFTQKQNQIEKILIKLNG